MTPELRHIMNDVALTILNEQKLYHMARRSRDGSTSIASSQLRLKGVDDTRATTAVVAYLESKFTNRPLSDCARFVKTGYEFWEGRQTPGDPTTEYTIPCMRSSIPPQPTQPTKEATMTITIKTITYVNGQDVETLSNGTLHTILTQANAELKRLEDLPADQRPKRLTKQIKEHKASIDALVALIDKLDEATS